MMSLVGDRDVITAADIVHLCLYCDTAPSISAGSKLRAGPPVLPGTDIDGWFVAPSEWQT